MATPIVGIPTTRISEGFVRERLLNQVMWDQEQLFKVQTQLSTGHRFEAPSDDPVAAMQVVSLQQLLARKDQMQTNVSTNQSFLTNTDTSIMSISGLMADARGITVGVMGTTSTDTQRRAAAQQVDQIVAQLLDTGNRQFRGRYLFAGSQTSVRPFEKTEANLVEYLGNEAKLSSFGDIAMLFDTNLPGSEVFGAISTVVRGAADLAPVSTFDTKLSDLFGGQGVSLGSIEISDGAKKSIVDLSKAGTLGDLAKLIKASPPLGREISVDITDKKLVLQLLPPTGGNFIIRDVGGGTTASELGIRRENGVGQNAIESRELKPALTRTTSLDDVLGAKAAAFLHSAGADNDLIVRADVSGTKLPDGTPLNGVKVLLQNDVSVTPGNEYVVCVPGVSLTVYVDQGYTRACQVRDAIDRAHQAGTIPFTAEIDPAEDRGGGQGLVDLRAEGTTANGWGEALDKQSGLQVVNRGATTAIDLSSTQTVEDLLNVVNGAGAGLLAEINEGLTGIDLRSRVNGCDFTIGENGGRTAAQLGLRTFTESVRLEDLNYGRGVHDWPAYTGTYSNATYTSAAPNSKLAFTAKNLGADWNGFTVEFVATSAAPSFTYDLAAKKMTFAINVGTTTANDVLQLFQGADQEVREAWDVSLGKSTDGSGNDGTGKVDAGTAPATAAGDDSGIDFYITRADGVKLAVDVAGATTVGDVLEKINNNVKNADHRLVAALSEYGNGIAIQDNSLGSLPLKIERNPQSTAAIDLGLIAAGQLTSAQATREGSSTATIASQAERSGLVITSRDPGVDLNGVRVLIDYGFPPKVVYSESAKTLTFDILPGSTANDLINLMVAQGDVNSRFAGTLDPADATANTGAGTVAVTAAPVVTSGGTASLHASATVVSAGYENDLVFTARMPGVTYNNVKISFVNNAEHVASVLSYVPGDSLVFGIDPGVSTAQDIVAALAAHPLASVDWSAAPAAADFRPNDGTGAVDATLCVPSAAAKSGLVFTVKDPSVVPNGLTVRFVAGAPARPIFDQLRGTLTFGITPGVTTAAGIIAQMALAPELAPYFSVDVSPNDNSHNDGSGSLAAQTLPLTGGDHSGHCSSRWFSFPGRDNDMTIRARASGVAFEGTNVDFTSVAAPGVTLDRSGLPGTLVVQYGPGATAQDVVAAFAADPDFVATLDPNDYSANLGQGQVDATSATLLPMTGGTQTIAGSDVNPQETESVFTALLRISSGLCSNDTFQVQRAYGMLDRKGLDMNFAQAELAAREQGLDMLQDTQASEKIDLQAALSDEYDANMEEVVSNLTARQAAYQASLVAMGKIFQMSLLNYI